MLQVIHGGPHTAFGDAFHFRWNVQAMAAQGYVVACVNYHGSSSFATPSSTASPTAGVSWSCRTWNAPPTGC